MMRNLFNIHATFGRDDEGDPAGFAIDEKRQIEFPFDLGSFLDIEPVDLLSGRAGLQSHQSVAEHFSRVLTHLGDRLRQPYAALRVRPELPELAFPATAGMDLGFHHEDRTWKPRSSLARIVYIKGRITFRHGNAKGPEQALGLVLVDMHRGNFLSR